MLKDAPSDTLSPTLRQPGGRESAGVLASRKLQELFPELEACATHHFFSEGTWSAHELLEHLLRLTGPACVTLAVWSISEVGARSIVQLKESGKITRLRALFDYRSNVRHPGALNLVRQACDEVRTLPCHAKVTVIRNDRVCVVMGGSSNYTRNPRAEAGYISTQPELCDFYEAHILNMIRNGVDEGTVE
jgi:hypothetical protein